MVFSMQEKGRFVLIISIALIKSLLGSTMTPWTWSYKKIFSKKEQRECLFKKELMVEKKLIAPFAQLIFSWNAERSPSGWLSFWVQGYQQEKKKWGPWHKMAEWGNGIQRSYLDEEGNRTKYFFVRLEAEKSCLLTGFRIKVIASEGARLDGLKSVFVSTSNVALFEPEPVDSHILSLPSVQIKHVPRQSQFMVEHPRNNHLCSPTSCSMLVGYLKQERVDPLLFAEKSFDFGLNSYGSWPFNMAHAFELCKNRVRFYVLRAESFLQIYRQLKKKIPVVVSVRGPLKGAERLYKNGHLIIVVGWNADTKTVVCHDPAFPTDDTVVTHYLLKDFLSAWERSKRLMYLAEPIDCMG